MLELEASVMQGGHYVKGKEGMAMIAEAMNALLFEQFLEDESDGFLEMSIEDLRGDIQRALAHLQQKDLESFKAVWLQSKLNSTGIQQRFKDWKTNSGNENVLYWAYFIDTVYPVLDLRDLTHAIRTGSWSLFISAKRRAMALFFVFGRTNYSRWGPIELQDSLDLQRKFPSLHAHFEKAPSKEVL